MKKTGEMTHKEAVRKALEMLGGRAHTQQIYPIAIKLIGNNTKSQNIKATIRRELNSSPYAFKPTPGKEGYWELIEYQEDIAIRDQRIKELEEENLRLKSIKTEDSLIEKILMETKKRFKHESERNKAVAVSQILAWSGREDASENIDEWLEGKEKPFMAFSGDYVVSKHVDHEIDYVETGGTGVNINKA